MLSDTELIRKLEFFEPLNAKIIRDIAKQCIARNFSEGDYIVRQGESGLGLYFITQGRAKVEIDRNGVRAFITELQEGDFLGELSMIDDKARSANVVCVEDTRCLLLTRDSFSKLVNKYPEIAIQMVKVLVGRIRASNEKITQRSAEAPGAAPAPPQPVETAPAASNGDSPFLNLPFSGSDVVKMYSDTKSKVQDQMVGLFKALYMMKTLTRFSLSLVGCPVTVRPEEEDPGVYCTTIHGVKVTLFPASRPQVLRIDSFADGQLSATIFRPIPAQGSSPIAIDRFVRQIRRSERLCLQIPVLDPIRLESSELRTTSDPQTEKHIPGSGRRARPLFVESPTPCVRDV